MNLTVGVWHEKLDGAFVKFLILRYWRFIEEAARRFQHQLLLRAELNGLDSLVGAT